MDISKRKLFSAPIFAALGMQSLAYAQSDNKSKCESLDVKPDYNLPIVNGHFHGNIESLKSYKVPNWFSDAKFGIWSHWGPQAVPRQGDWYARQMYAAGSYHYDYHVKHYGHPSKFGYKDIIPLWKAEKFDPEALMDKYVAAGAKYFVSMGVHHDNFDLWNSKHHKWNAVAMGPKRDIVGDWRNAAKKRGLKFGVSEHLGASHNWFHPSHGYDQFWPLNGQDYDGADPKYSDLYHQKHNEPYKNGSNPNSWYTTNPEFHQIWFNRIKDLIDNYQPDLLYSDGGLPFGVVGHSLVAHLYNKSIQVNGKLEAVYNIKDIGSGEFYPDIGVQDVERGVLNGINPRPWQTDTSIGDWFYSDNYKYKTTPEIIYMLSDIVSKNGCLLLNVVQYPDGSLPPECEKFLSEMAQWMKVNSEAIHGTRPWKIHGEGPTTVAAGAFKESGEYTSKDIRYTSKGNAIYAITLGEPKGEIILNSLGKNNGFENRAIRQVRMLGFRGALNFSQNENRMVVKIPEKLPSNFASVLKIII